jgi:hypothetical protein
LSDEQHRAHEALTRAIVQTWADVLELSPQTVADSQKDFVALGGESLLMVEVATALKRRFPVKASLIAVFFGEPTIDALRAAIAAELSESEILARAGSDARTT